MNQATGQDAASGATNVDTPPPPGHTPREKTWLGVTLTWLFAIIVIGSIILTAYHTFLSPTIHWIGKKIDTVNSVESLKMDVYNNALIQQRMIYWQNYQGTNLTILSTNIDELREMVSGLMRTMIADGKSRTNEYRTLWESVSRLGASITNIDVRMEDLTTTSSNNAAANEKLFSRIQEVNNSSIDRMAEMRKQFAMLRTSTSNDLRLVEKVVPAAATTNIEQNLALMREKIISDVKTIIANSRVSLAPTNPVDDHVVVTLPADQLAPKKAARKTPKKTVVADEKTNGYYYVTNYIVVPPQKVAEIAHVRGVQIQAMFLPQDTGWWGTDPGSVDRGEPYKVLSSREEKMEALNVMVVRWSKKAPPHPKLVYTLKDYAVSWPDAPSANPAHTQAGVRK